MTMLSKAAARTPRVHAPRLITAEKIGLRFVDEFGGLGPELHVTGHHTAGAKDHSDVHAVALAQQYHREHAEKGWGGIGYHAMICRSGTILLLRPTALLGAHVGMHNTSNLGIVFCGTVGDRPTVAQQRSLQWYLARAHTTRLPVRHRTDRDLRRATLHGHRDWPDHHSNECPGTHYRLIKSGGKTR